MATLDIRKFYFYFRYLWQAQDFTDFQEYLFDYVENLAEGLGPVVLKGLEPAPQTGMTVSVAAGIAAGSLGRIMLQSTSGSVTFATPSGNPARSLCVLRPTSTDTTLIPDPANPSGPTVPKFSVLGSTLLVLNGTPGVNPTYPATQAGDVVLFGVRLTAGQTTIAASDIDQSVRAHRPGVVRNVNRYISSDYTVAASDSLVEVDSTLAARTVTLPAASASFGRELTIYKADDSVNEVFVTSTDLISGQSTQIIDSQHGSITAISNGLTWRMI